LIIAHQIALFDVRVDCLERKRDGIIDRCIRRCQEPTKTQ